MSKVYGVAFACVAVLTSCSDAVSENIESKSQALGICGHGSYAVAWASNGGSTPIRSLSDHVCWLTKAGGRFDGQKGSNVGVSVEPRNDGNWWLVTRSTEEYGEAHCLPLSCFRGDGVDDVVWVSTSNLSALAVSSGSCDTDSSNAWWGDAATIAQAWPGGTGPGRTEGGGEYVHVQQSLNPFGSSVLTAGDCQWRDGPGGWIRNQGTSLFVGTPSSGVAASFSSGVSTITGNSTKDLNVFADDAICYFTHIHGKFRGGGEYVRLFQQPDAASGRDKWFAQAGQGSAGSDIYAQIRCFNTYQPSL